MDRNHDSATFDDFDSDELEAYEDQGPYEDHESSFANDLGDPTPSDSHEQRAGVVPTPREQSKSSSSRAKRRKMHCFACNRSEGHFLVVGKRWFFSYLLGLTFGLVLLVGPYRCQCCGTTRWLAYDRLNPRFWFRQFMHGELVSARPAKRRRRK